MKFGDLNKNNEAELKILLEQFIGRPNTEEVRKEMLSVMIKYTEGWLKYYIPLNTRIKEGEIERISKLLGVRDNGKD